MTSRQEDDSQERKITIVDLLSHSVDESLEHPMQWPGIAGPSFRLFGDLEKGGDEAVISTCFLVCADTYKAADSRTSSENWNVNASRLISIHVLNQGWKAARMVYAYTARLSNASILSSISAVFASDICCASSSSPDIVSSEGKRRAASVGEGTYCLLLHWEGGTRRP